MSLLEDGLKGLAPSLLVSIGAVIAAPIVIPAVMGGMRPLAKTAIKGYLFLSDSLKEALAEAGEQISDIVAETRHEATATGTTMAGTAGMGTGATTVSETEGTAAAEEEQSEEGKRGKRRG
jgi:uncharacterized protein (UPF0254 family)